MNDQASHNSGLQANSVVGGAIAVGTNAQAHNHVIGTLDHEAAASMKLAVAALQEALAGLGLPPPAVKVLQQETDGLHELAASGHAPVEKVQSLLSRLKDKLLMVGIVLTDVVALADPIKRIAESLKLPLSKLGL
jgi:gamma-glutamyl phosphate reductase